MQPPTHPRSRPARERWIARAGLWCLAAGLVAGVAGPCGQALAANPASPQKPALPPLPPPPLLPPPRNPVDALRHLLALSPAGREAALASRSEAQRTYLRKRMGEFDAGTATERELMLRSLQLRYYLLPLMKTSPGDRAPQLRAVPAEDRDVIEERLKAWDRVPLDEQKDLLQNEDALRCFPRFETNNPARQAELLQNLPPEQRTKLEQDLARWHAYPVEQRERMYSQFQQFFSQSSRERTRTLEVLPEGERRQAQRTLETFQKLPAEQRAKCLAAFQKFSTMSSADRERFLRNAARWEAMSTDERQAWRELVAKMPPLPPGLGAPPLPPIPPPMARPPVVSNATPLQP